MKQLIFIVVGIVGIFYVLTRPYTVGEDEWCAFDSWGNKQCYYDSKDDCMEIVDQPNSIWIGCTGK